MRVMVMIAMQAVTRRLCITSSDFHKAHCPVYTDTTEIQLPMTVAQGPWAAGERCMLMQGLRRGDMLQCSGVLHTPRRTQDFREYVAIKSRSIAHV